MDRWLALSLLFCFGDYLGLSIKSPYHDFFLPLAASGLELFFAGVNFQRKIPSAVAAFLPAVLLTSGLLLGWSAKECGTVSSAFWQKEVSVRGTISPDTVRESADGNITFTLKVDPQLRSALGDALRLTVVGVKREDKEKYNYGRIEAAGKVYPLRTFADPGVYDTETAAHIAGIGGRMTVKAENVHFAKKGKDFSAYLAEFNRTLKKQLQGTLAEKEAALVAGMTLGGYSDIDGDVLQNFTTTGIIHILSVSGSHVALLTAFLLVFCRSFAMGRRATTGITALTLVLYTAICGFSPPVLWSLVMGLAMLLGQLWQRKENRGAVFFFAVLFLLCVHPYWLWDLGFQLSFASTAGLIYLCGSIETFLRPYAGHFIGSGLAVTLAAQLATLPFLVHYFHQVSLISLAANLLVVPLIEFVVLLSLAGMFLGSLWPLLGKPFILLGGLLLDPAVRLTFLLGTVPWAVFALPRQFAWTAAVYYWALGNTFKLLPYPSFLSYRWAVFAPCVLLVFSAGAAFLPPRALTVYFLDVGQGDAAVVITSEKKVLVVDTGGLPGNFDVGRRVLVPFLRYAGVRKIDILALSHGDHDHAGEAAQIAEAFPIEHILLAREEATNDVNALLRKVRGQSKVSMAEDGRIYRFGEGKLLIVNAQDNFSEKTAGNANESSVIMKLEYGGHSILFTGDATEDEEIRATGRSVKTEVLKVAHHGSLTSSSLPFLRASAPQLAVISVGYANRFGHPAPETLEKFRDLGIKVLRTDELGCVKVVFDGPDSKWYSYRYQKELF